MEHGDVGSDSTTPVINLDKIMELDVRPILQTGGEPFAQIMSAIQSIPEDGALRLRTTFKPTPLFHVLAKKGWSNKIEHGDGDDWIVLFYKSNTEQITLNDSALKATIAHLLKDKPELRQRLKTEGNIWYLDVRTLPPPEPMELTLSVVENLPPGISLIQINERIPHLLLPTLEERGYFCRILPATQSETEIYLEIKPASQ